MFNRVISKSGADIRLTDERWAHIMKEHCELAGFGNAPEKEYEIPPLDDLFQYLSEKC